MWTSSNRNILDGTHFTTICVVGQVNPQNLFYQIWVFICPDGADELAYLLLPSFFWNPSIFFALKVTFSKVTVAASEIKKLSEAVVVWLISLTECYSRQHHQKQQNSNNQSPCQSVAQCCAKSSGFQFAFECRLLGILGQFLLFPHFGFVGGWIWFY